MKKIQDLINSFVVSETEDKQVTRKVCKHCGEFISQTCHSWNCKTPLKYEQIVCFDTKKGYHWHYCVDCGKKEMSKIEKMLIPTDAKLKYPRDSDGICTGCNSPIGFHKPNCPANRGRE